MDSQNGAWGRIMFSDMRSAQFVWFTTSDVSLDHEAFFKELSGMGSDVTQRLKPPQAPVPMTIISGVADDIQYRLQSQPGRFDFFAAPVDMPPSDPTVPMLRGVKNSETIIKRVLLAAEKFAEQLNTVYRLAFVTQYFKLCKDEDEARSHYTKLIASTLPLVGSRELAYQISSTKDVDGRTLNRLIRWQTENVQSVFFPMQTGFASYTMPVPRQENYLTYMIDTNSMPTNLALLPKQQIEIWGSLIKENNRLWKISTVEEM
jgi:hypothetical protein